LALRSRTAAHISLQVIVLLWGATAILGRQISIHAIPLVWYRLLLVVPVLAFYVRLRRIPLRIPAATAARYAIAGALIGLHWLCFYGAVKVGGVASAVTALSTVAFFTALVEPFVFKRRLAIGELAIGALVVGASVILSQYELRVNALGLALGYGSAFLAGVFGTLNGKFAHDEHPERMMLYEFAAALLVVTAMFPFAPSQLVIPPDADLPWLVVFAVVCTVIPQVWIIYILRTLSPFTVAVSVNLEPVYALCFAALLFPEESLTLRFYVGALILFALVMLNGMRRVTKTTPATHAD
jgi:drug/metabolite transporter (DMT)-like permease